jgi:hypothetical protein
MKELRRAIPAVVALFLIVCGSSASAALGDANHARIVRVSYVQGEARFARDVKGDPLSDSQATWETAVLNLPIRQGYVLATDNGRMEVEFENGAMAILAENTVLQFYDLSSEDGGFTTRLILRQGSAEFSVNPERGDYFSVTGGDFSVQAENKTSFRMNNFDDGSNVVVLHGKVTALTNGKTTSLGKGQQLSMRAGDAESVEVGRAPENDEFDQWASGRISTSEAATNASLQYTNNSGYVSGYDDLYTYGSWFPVAGYGYCWRPYGVGVGWAPFDYGSWYYDTAFGWAFLGGYSWGWLPYHYGGWLFQPGVGWVWSPNGTLGGVGAGRWRPVTGIWMRNSSGGVAIVPAHPLDVRGKTPLNMAQGMFEVSRRGVTGQLPALQNDTRWKVEGKPGREVIENQLAEVAAPTRVSRAMTANVRPSAPGEGGEGSTIVYDRTERKFVNSNAVGRATQPAQNGAQNGMKVYPESAMANSDAHAPSVPERSAGKQGQPRQFVASPPRVAPAPPSVPRSVANERASNATEAWGGARGGNGAGAGAASSRAAAPSAGPSASAGRGGGGGAPSAGGGGGGRPH